MKLFLFALASTLLASPLAAQVAPKPAVGPTPSFTLPATESFRLPNGMTVTLLPYGKVPKATIAVQLLSGSADEARNVWLSQLTGEMLDEGAGDRNAAAIADAAAAMGGDLAVGTGELQTVVQIDVLSESAANAIALVGDVVRRPTLPASEFDRVKQDLSRGLAVARSQPGPIATALFLKAYYGDSVYGQALPTEAQLAAYRLDDVRAFHAANFQSNRARIYVAGQFDRAAVKSAIERAFGDWKGGPERALPRASASGQPRVIMFNRPGAPQTTIRLGFGAPATGAADDIAMRVTNALLAGSFTSRITQNIREDKGYTYSPSASIRRHIGESGWTFNADVTTKDTAAALKEVFAEIRRLQSETPPNEEAQGMANWMAGTFILNNGSTDGLVGSLMTRDLYGLPDDWMTRYVPSVLSVDAATMRSTAGRYLPLDKMTLVLVGDLAAVRPQVEALPELKAFKVEVAAAP
jgi:zinc protease